jgi:hypothetical protein
MAKQKQRKYKRRAKKIITDPAIVNFLLEHLRPSKIDFSKIKIPPYINIIK